MFPSLFSPIKINKTEIKNRTVYPALGLVYSYDGKINDKYFDFYVARARGGTGIVTIGPAAVDYYGGGPIMLSLAKDEEIPSFAKLTAAVKKEGAKAWTQLFHSGAYQFPMLINGERPVGPSEVYSKYSKATPRALTIEEIKALQESFVKAAERARDAGFDGVEIIASAGYLITQFLSPVKNLRTDEYGGSFENRVRFPREIIELMRKRLGPDFPITIRMAGNDFVPESNTDLETPEFAKVYEKAGVNAISVTGGWHEALVPQMPMELPRGGYAYLAYNIKRAVSVPVIASNRITDPYTADKLIRDGMADMVNLGRVLIADPEWAKKAKEGRPEEIRPCVACSQGCSDMIFSGKAVFCITNPFAGFEFERKIKKSRSPKRVMIVGAGPAGLQAAITAAEAGHSVELYEKGNDIGGQLHIAGAPPRKDELGEIIRYFRVMLNKYKVKPITNKEVDIKLIKRKKPDYVIIAEGAVPFRPPIKGLDDKKVVSSWTVLDEDTPLGKNIAIIGGGAVGLETALFLAQKGTITPEALHFLMAYEAESPDRLRDLMFKGTKKITLFEMLPKIGQDVGKSVKWIMFGNLERYGVDILTGARVLSVTDGRVTFEKDGKQEIRDFDNIILAAGSSSVKNLSAEIDKTGIPYSVIGDCVKPGKINDAIHGGFLAAVKIK